MLFLFVFRSFCFVNIYFSLFQNSVFQIQFSFPRKPRLLCRYWKLEFKIIEFDIFPVLFVAFSI